jgi:spermidine synthase
VPKALLKDLPGAHVDVSEIEPSLRALGEEYFRVPRDEPRLSTYIEDGRRFLDKSGKTYDYIFSDVYYSLYSIPAHFTTVEFFRLAKSRLSKDGVFIANLVGSLAQTEPSFLLSELRTFREVFPNSHAFAVVSPAVPQAQNVMIVGWNSDKEVDFGAEEIADSKDPFIAALFDHRIDLDNLDLGRHPVLTDDYAPVDYMNMRMLKTLL